MTNKNDYAESEEKFKKYFAIKYWDSDTVYVRIFNEDSDKSRMQLQSAHRNKMIEKVSGIYWSDCRENSLRIAKEEFGIAEEI